MKVSDLMTTPVARCELHQNLADAARVMWNGDCGFVPILDPADGTLVGILTDRDACMAAALRGRTLAEIPVAEIMTRNVATIGPGEPIERALDQMERRQLRRLPVIDKNGAVVGVLSANDLFRAAPKSGKRRTAFERRLVEAMAKVCEPRHVEQGACTMDRRGARRSDRARGQGAQDDRVFGDTPSSAQRRDRARGFAAASAIHGAGS